MVGCVLRMLEKGALLCEAEAPSFSMHLLGKSKPSQSALVVVTAGHGASFGRNRFRSNPFYFSKLKSLC